jgi:site-specific DNA-cytosine methylase
MPPSPSSSSLSRAAPRPRRQQRLLRSLDLFSGVGGITRALEGLAQPLAYCDWAPEARACLEANMASGRLPRAPVSSDVRELNAAWLRAKAGGAPDVIVGGFPCVGFSALGNRRGFEERQSGLFSEILRLADETRAPMLFLENVPNVLHMGMHDIAHELTAKRGYELRWAVLRADAVGAPHARPRWYCLALRPGFRHRFGGTAAARRYEPFPWGSRSMPPRGAPASTPETRNTIALLGNSVVPDAVRYAFLCLATTAMDGSAPPLALPAGGLELVPAAASSPPSRSSSRYRTMTDWPTCGVLGVGADAARRCARPPPLRPPPRLSLRFDPRLFRTAKPPSSMLSAPLIRRAVEGVDKWATPRHGCTSACNYLTTRSLRDLPTQVRFEASTADRHRGGGVNPAFVEWLMGYPAGYTAPHPSTRRAT